LFNWNGAEGKLKYQFTGQEFNDDFGLGWSHHNARFYDAALGRWHSVDLLAEATISETPYHYCSNNPVNMIDPSGLKGGPADGDPKNMDVESGQQSDDPDDSGGGSGDPKDTTQKDTTKKEKDDGKSDSISLLSNSGAPSSNKAEFDRGVPGGSPSQYTNGTFSCSDKRPSESSNSTPSSLYGDNNKVVHGPNASSGGSASQRAQALLFDPSLIHISGNASMINGKPVVDIRFGVKNTPADCINIIQTVYCTDDYNSLPVNSLSIDGNLFKCFVDGVTETHSEVYYNDIKDLSNENYANLKWEEDRGEITLHDNPTAAHFNSKLVFEASVVAINYLNTGRDLILGSVIYGFSNFGKNTIHQSIKINPTMSKESREIIRKQFPNLKFYGE
jgi:RHS repeat-associated protein